MTDIAHDAAGRKPRRSPSPTPAPTPALSRLRARLARGAVPLSELEPTDREAVSLGLRRREVLLSAIGGIAYAMRARP